MHIAMHILESALYPVRCIHVPEQVHYIEEVTDQEGRGEALSGATGKNSDCAHLLL